MESIELATFKIDNVRKEMSKQTCENCKHWAKGNDTTGKCLKSKSKHPMMFSPCGLYTNKDFGCKLFEEK
jgi:hypothetical protein